jgi:hypothetical protein
VITVQMAFRQANGVQVPPRIDREEENRMARLLDQGLVWLRLLFLIRFPVLTGLLLASFPILAHTINPELLGNLLVLETRWQLFNITWLTFLLSAFVLIASRLIQNNAGDRFGDYAAALKKLALPAKGPAGLAAASQGVWRWRWLWFLILGLPLPIACILAINDDPSEVWTGAEDSFLSKAWQPAALVVLAGALFAIVLLLLLTALQELLIDPLTSSPGLLPFESWWPFTRLHNISLNWLYPLGRWLAKLLSQFGPGYTQTVTNPRGGAKYIALAPGHSQAFLWLGATLFVYFGSFAFVYNTRLLPGESSPFAALFFVLLLLLLSGVILTGVSFLLDYFRIPALLTLVLVSLGLNYLHDTDHYYQLNPLRAAGKGAPAPDLDWITASANRKFPSGAGNKKTLVVVTAAGGGIQASAWTTKVLSGLDDVYGAEFTKSIALISGTSGGSVGSMFYLANGKWDNAAPLDEAAKHRMQSMSRASNLEADAWGVALPDFMRVFTPILVPHPADRGWAIEEIWRRELSVLGGDWQDGDLRLRDWIDPIRAGQMPVPIFNATLVESGQRLLLSPVVRRPSAKNGTEAQELFNLYKQADPRVTTAVRLSAAFPYVSPVARPDLPDSDETAYHVADGGYSDNEGAVAALEWVYNLLLYYRQQGSSGHKPFNRILIVRIAPFPIRAKSAAAQKHTGALYELLGPLTTIENVRTASQTERNSLALELLTDATLKDLDPDTQNRRQQGQALLARGESLRVATNLHGDMQQPDANAPGNNSDSMIQEGTKLLRSVAGDTEITWTQFIFRPDDPDGFIPLSWKLTPRQKTNIDQAWCYLLDRQNVEPLPPISNGLNESPFQTVDRFFHNKLRGH